MKLNKVKLTAMAMSVMMAMSSMSVATFAEENVTDVAIETVETTTDAAEEETATSETQPVSEVTDEEGKPALYAEAEAQKVDFDYLEVAYQNKDKANASKDTIIVHWTDGMKTSPLSVTVSITDATCAKEEVRSYTVEISPGKMESTVKAVEGSIRTDHTWGEPKKEMVEEPTCEHDGWGWEVQRCTVCGIENPNYKKKIVEDAIEHVSTSPTFIKYLVEEDYFEDVQLSKDVIYNTYLPTPSSKPALKDPRTEGTYYEVYNDVCAKCGKTYTTKKLVKMEATQIAYTTVEEMKNINTVETAARFYEKGLIKNNNFADVTSDLLKTYTNLIVLEDCLKAGSYQVYYHYQTDSTNPIKEKVSVPAHHSEEKTVVFVNAADADKCTWYTDTNGTVVTVKNNTCNKDILYYIHTECRGCDREWDSNEMVAEPQGPHTVDAEVKMYLSTHITDGILIPDEDGLYHPYQYLLMWLAQNGKSQYVNIDTTATCTENGETTVTLLCTTCKKPTDVVFTAKTDMFNHYSITKNAVVEVKESTCSAKGYIINADKCELCEKELSNRVTKEIKRLAHTNEIGINDNGTSMGLTHALDATATVELVGNVLIDVNGETLAKGGKYISNAYLLLGEDPDHPRSTTGKLEVRVYNYCSVCNGNKANITDGQDSVKIRVASVTKETEAKAGSITLDVQVEGKDEKGGQKMISTQLTAPYYSNMAAYLDRKDSTVKLNGLQLVDGKFYYYKDDVVDTSFKGLVEYNGKLFYVENGTVATGVNGAKLIADTWYFLAYGMVQTDYVGLTTYGGKAFYVQNGIIDVNVGGLVEFDGRKFAVASGRIIDEYSGLWQDPASGKWYYLVRGQVTDKTTLVLYDGAWFYVIDGKLASDFTGTVNYDGAKFNVVKGQVYGQA